MKLSRSCCLHFFLVFSGFLFIAPHQLFSDQITYEKNQFKEKFYYLTEGWEFYWEDLPKTETGDFLWPGNNNRQDREWSSIEFPSNPPLRDGKKIVWYRVQLPDRQFRDPTLFITSIDINAEFFIDEEKIYSFGTINAAGEGSFVGWPIQVIELPKDFVGKLLYIRVYSNYRDIGLWGDIYIGEGKDILRGLFQKGIIGLSVLIVSALIGIVFFILYIINKNQKTLIYLAILSFALSLRVFGGLSLHLFPASNPMMWEYLDIVTILLIPVCITLILHTIVSGRYAKATSILWKGFVVFGILIVFLLIFGMLQLTTAYFLTDLSSFIGVLGLGYISFQNGRRGTMEQKLISINFLVMAALVVYSFFMSYGLLPWVYEFDYIMVFQFSLGMALILGRRFFMLVETLRKQSFRLGDINKELERLVAKRTEEIEEARVELEEANRALEEERNTLRITSVTDGLTGLYNRTYIDETYRQEIREAVRYGRAFSLALFDIDHFKKVNDEHGHLVGDSVLKSISLLFKKVLRETDIAGRYGGEEFIILFPNTEENDAKAVCERLRKEVESLVWIEGPERVTISGGVASYQHGSVSTEEMIIRNADKNLYMAKESGRNMVLASAIIKQE